MFCSKDHEMNIIQSNDHNIGLYRICKNSLSSYNHEKYILRDGFSRLSVKRQFCLM